MPFGRWNEVNSGLTSPRVSSFPKRPHSARTLQYPPPSLNVNNSDSRVYNQRSILQVQRKCENFQEEFRFLRHQLELKDRCISELETQIRGLSSQIREYEKETSNTRKGSCGGISDTSESCVDPESVGPCMKLQFSRYHMKVARGHASARTSSARHGAESQTRPKPRDDIDEVVQEYLREIDQVGRIRWVSHGVYLLGNRKIGVTVKNGKPLVRIGGGAFVHLEVYLVNH
jgi:hypothetical protein